jgi:hypothetical protein
VHIGQAGIKITAGKRKCFFLSVETTGTYIKTFIVEVPKFEFVSYFKDDD